MGGRITCQTQVSFCALVKVIQFRLHNIRYFCSAHPNTVTLLGLLYDKGTGTLGLVCELMDQDLAAWLRESPPVEDRASVLSTSVDGLAFIHASGLVHRDVKPGNIFVDDQFSIAKIGDFGLTSVVGGREGWTRSYAAPEVLLKIDVSTAASDAYSFGLVVYEVLAGVKSMPTGEDRLFRTWELPWVLKDELPVPVGWWAMELRRALSPHPGDRPPVSDWVPVLEVIRITRRAKCSRFFGLCLTGRWDEAMACNDGVELAGVNMDGGGNALHYVAASTDAPLAMVAKCLKFGCDINAISDSNGPPLVWAQTAEMAAELVAHGADVNATDKDMVTPLMYAAKSNRTVAVRFLLAAGADPTAVDSEGRTAIDWAYGRFPRPSEDVALLHLDAGVVPGDREAALEEARREGHHRVVARLEGGEGGAQ